MQRMGSMMTLFFVDTDVINWPSAARADRKRFAEYFWGMIRHGVYMPCSQFEALFFSATHTPEHIDYTVDAAKKVLKTLNVA
jgi:glutamate-1-semialdehyde 2,1-aminomutase